MSIRQDSFEERAPTVEYAVAYAYNNNSNMYECIKYVRKHFPEYTIVEDSRIEEIWDAIDAYVDVHE